MTYSLAPRSKRHLTINDCSGAFKSIHDAELRQRHELDTLERFGLDASVTTRIVKVTASGIEELDSTSV